MRDRFVLKGPAERKEGGSTREKTTPDDAPANAQPNRASTEVSAHGNLPNEEHVPDPAISKDPKASLIGIVSQSDRGIKLTDELRGKYELDPAFQAVLKRPGDFRNFEIIDQLVYLKESDRQVLCIPKILIRGRSAREIVISEAHSMLAHLGASKTLDYLRDHVWW
ncbi:hypothetical protein BYT27DRAFT_7118804, partial [Phlegmacium glaucopus]